MAVGDAYVFPGFLTPVLTQLFFPKPPTTFLTWRKRGGTEREERERDREREREREKEREKGKGVQRDREREREELLFYTVEVRFGHLKVQSRTFSVASEARSMKC